MRTYLVDGTNVVRRAGFDPRFPSIEDANTDGFLSRLNAAAAAYAGRIQIEVFFDGPFRFMVNVDPPVFIRFPIDGYADGAIIGSARALLASGRGAVVVTGDGGLAVEAAEDGARVIGYGELLDRLREGRP